MAYTPGTFRIFVSSTFSDLKAERNALQARVFPRLRDLAAVYGCRFQVIDLRWGVSEEASLDQQAMNICLGEVARCQQITPRPNFIVLLGDRYGWMPPPSQIPDDEFQQIMKVVEGIDKALLEEWYTLDENAVPHEWRLKPRHAGSPYEEYDGWQPVEAQLQRILAVAAIKLEFAGEKLLPYTASATEQEIAAGAFRVKDAPEHVSCFFRTIDGLPRQFDVSARDFLDLDEEHRQIDEDAHNKQEALKKRLADYVPGNHRTYYARWTGDGITTDHIDLLCEDVLASLSRIILEEIEHPREASPAEEVPSQIRADDALDDDGRAHHKFAEERQRFFVGRAGMLAKIAGYPLESGHCTLAIVGGGGTGKSALMARAVKETQKAHPDAQIVYRFIGVTPSSSVGRGLLDGLCREISRRYGADETNVPLDYRDLATELGKRVGLASADKPLILFVDSLDQLSESQGARGLAWLPDMLPEYVTVVVSTRPEEDIVCALRAKQAHEARLDGLSRREGTELLLQWLQSVGRTLQDAQQEEVLAKFEQSEGNPLYLKLAFEEARLWTSVQPQEALAVGVSGIIRTNMFDRLEHESSHGKMLISHALGYLAASRYGLAEEELVDVLSRDVEVYEWFFRHSHHLPADLVQRAIEYRREIAGVTAPGDGESCHDEEGVALAWLKEIQDAPELPVSFLKEVLPRANGPRLPIVLWSRLSFDLAPYLTERLVDGSPLLTFYHRELGEASQAAFLSDDQERTYHSKLADYFRSRADPAGDGSWTGNSIHGLSELPYHLTAASSRREAYQTLADFKFLEHKAQEVGILIGQDSRGNPVKTSVGVLQIQEDIDRLRVASGAEAQGLTGEQGAVLQALSRALAREFHLTHYPELLWQQLHNRLQWEDGPAGALVAAERELRSMPGAVPWARTRTRFRESAALLRTLAGHLGGVHACAVSPDGAWIVSASWDNTLKIWDAATGRELRTLTGHTEAVRGCAVSPDGAWIVSASWDNTLKIWDAVTGRELRTLTGHTNGVNACAVSPDGAWIVSAGEDLALKIWDAASGLLLRTLSGGRGVSVRGCAVSPDGAWIVSASEGVDSLQIWDAATGRELRVLKGHSGYVNACAVSPDGAWIVSAGNDETLKIWDSASGLLLRTLTGHTGSVDSCAISRDGSWIVSASWDQTLKIWDSASGLLLRTLIGHTNEVDACAVSPDGTWIVSAGDVTLRVWDAASGANLPTLAGHTGMVYGCAVSPDGAWAVSASHDKMLKMWDVASGRELRTLTGHTGRVSACAISPDGAWIASVSHDQTLKIWDTATGRELRVLTGHTSNEIYGCAVSPDGAWIVSACHDQTLKIWDAATGREVATLIGHTDDVTACAVSPDGAWIVSAGEDKTLKIWDAASGLLLRTLTGHTGRVSACAVSRDGAWIVSASWDNTLKIWDAATGSELRTLVGHTHWVTGCAVSPDGTWIVSAGADRTLRMWDAATGHEKLIVPLSGALKCVALHPRQPFAACGDSGGGFHLLDLVGVKYGPIIVTAAKGTEGLVARCPACKREHAVTERNLGTEFTCPTPECGLRLKLNPFVVGKQPNVVAPLPSLARTVTGHTEAVEACAISPDGTWIVSAGDDKKLNVWNAATGRQLRALAGHTHAVLGCAVSPDGAWIVSASWDNTLKIWDAATGRERRTLSGHAEGVRGCAVSPDGAWIVSAGRGWELRVWDAATGSQLHTLKGHAEVVMRCAVSPDGAWIVSASWDKTLKIWDAVTGRLLLTLSGHRRAVHGCAISPDGAWIVSAGDDKTLKIWDSVSGRELRTLVGHTGVVYGCAVSPDGAWIASASWDGTLRVWDAGTGREKLTLPLPGALRCVSLHPLRPFATCGDSSGSLYLLDLAGIEYGPIIVTATRKEQQLVVRCPSCQHSLAIHAGSLGGEVSCPWPGCGTRLRVNRFLMQTGWPGGEIPAAQSVEGACPEFKSPAGGGPKKNGWLSRLWTKR
jgi:WD40 repeat protein